MSGPDSSKTPPFLHGALRERFEDAKFETDLADLATRFAAQSGGGLSPELSADLALEIVLNEIVEQACLATGATGSAIVLERDGEMVCRATSGSTAPELGSRLDTTSGLSGECFKTQHTQWCDDALSDQRVDAEASARLGVRSIVVMPLLRGAKLAGVVELFSAQPYAFGVRDERTLEVLADRTLRNLDHAARPLELQKTSGPNANPTERPSGAKPSGMRTPGPSEQRNGDRLQKTENRAREEWSKEDRTKEEPSKDEWLKEDRQSRAQGEADRTRRLFSSRENETKHKRQTRAGWRGVDWLLGAAALACAILLGLAVGRHWGAQDALFLRHRTTKTAEKPPQNPSQNSSANSGTTRPPSSDPAKAKDERIPPGGLLVLEDGKEVFRMPPKENRAAGADKAVGMKRAASLEPEGVMELSPAAAENSLLARVEPEYPEAAREQKIQGTVLLEVHISANGDVQDVQVVSGQPILAQAASEAVKQWKFKPRQVNGSPAEMQTKITLNFRLPK
jgi:TonB family protein